MKMDWPKPGGQEGKEGWESRFEILSIGRPFAKEISPVLRFTRTQAC